MIEAAIIVIVLGIVLLIAASRPKPDKLRDWQPASVSQSDRNVVFARRNRRRQTPSRPDRSGQG